MRLWRLSKMFSLSLISRLKIDAVSQVLFVLLERFSNNLLQLQSWLLIETKAKREPFI